MFDFLKSKTKMRPEEFGIMLATVLAGTWFQKIVDYVMGFKELADAAESELGGLWQTLLLLHCVVISNAVESSSIQPHSKKVILDAFWSAVSDLLKECISEQDSSAFEANTPILYPKLQELIDSPSQNSTGPGRALFEMAMPNKNIRSHMDAIDELGGYFLSTRIALGKFTLDSIKATKLEKSLMVYE